ncbi:NTP transferase domain-containing protein [Halobacteriovorax sp. GB3]|uniref:NTP transferase domain-containing protein n=1 Tax=Halobacteriovorax sp. GB3 TaxID=2719615 RepID=UPI0023606434|nr:NTP transferase domain-containing protein [Halobacteriovorax sp. GB3]MDD0854789.1 NTP transferase domain-containing protein [Halobacteriovorax sp. GB3]
MKVKSALILSAGFGTRMGKIGKSLPKPLWPFNGTTLLAEQIQFVRSLGIEDIYVNVHHQAEDVISYVERFFPSVHILHEKEILGSGGAIHNVAHKLSYCGSLLTINSDVLISMNHDEWKEFFLPLMGCSRLLALPVKEIGYNEFILNKSLLSKIEKSTKENYYTYAGVGIIDLEKIDETPGESSFFQTVADFKNKEVEVYRPKTLSYTDYGTLDLYLANIGKIKISSEIGFLKILKKNGKTKLEYLNYGSKTITQDEINPLPE